ncbi:MAG TPA: proline--tRNA ligase [Chloroflexota bacterium]|jgi:prolyl-tRNA synthetase|nr:proline--tRNA ligase [Chloroflexota bacterium]
MTDVEADIDDQQEDEPGSIADWYIRTVLDAELADYTAVRGSIAIRPYGYAIWEGIQAYVDRELKATGHKNAYFPLFIPMSFIRKEADHVEGFAPELAVVTHGGGQKLAEELVVRPTSETIIYDMYRKWINSYRDLPVLINQWANVVRWEMRTRPFLRGMEFLWQEGHTAHATAEEADEEARLILDIYVRFIESQLAIPVYSGKKTEREKFAGAKVTYTMESLMRDGKALQMGTSHNLGQNFGKAFDVKFLDRDGEQKFPWSTSWAITTRLIGALVLVHGDEKGLNLPPKIAPIQVVIVPIWRKDEERVVVEEAVTRVEAELAAAGIRTEVDRRDTVTPGFKFNHWELRGVPIRLEIGPRDVAAGQVTSVRRDSREKTPVGLANLSPAIHETLEQIQTALFARAIEFRAKSTHAAESMAQLIAGLDESAGFYWVNWCGSDACEDAFVTNKASIRAIPMDDGDRTPTGPCIVCGKPAESRVLVAKSY